MRNLPGAVGRGDAAFAETLTSSEFPVNRQHEGGGAAQENHPRAASPVRRPVHVVQYTFPDDRFSSAQMSFIEPRVPVAGSGTARGGFRRFWPVPRMVTRGPGQCQEARYEYPPSSMWRPCSR